MPFGKPKPLHSWPTNLYCWLTCDSIVSLWNADCGVRRPSVESNSTPSNRSYTITLPMIWGFWNTKIFFRRLHFWGKNSFFGVFEKNFDVDWFSRRDWGGPLIPREKLTYTRGLRLVKEFWWSDNFSYWFFIFFVKSAFSEINFIVTHRHYMWTQWQTVVICMSKHVT